MAGAMRVFSRSSALRHPVPRFALSPRALPGVILSRPNVPSSGANKPPWEEQHDPSPWHEREFERNRGRTIDVLRESYPTLFECEPDLSIYRDDIQFHGFHGVPASSIRGLSRYRRLLYALRMARKTTVADAELTYSLSMPEDTLIRVRWQAQLWLRLPLRPLTNGIGDRAAPLYVDGISAYELDEDDGRVAVHRLEYLHPLPTTKQAELAWAPSFG